MQLKTFQTRAKQQLLDKLRQKNEIKMQAPTGAGKTIILSYMIKDFLDTHEDVVFFWLSPGAGELEEQSMDKFAKYIPEYKAKDLDEVLSDGFENKDVVFINWERLTKKDNKATRDAETQNLQQRIAEAKDNGLCFILIIDEAHKNDTDKAKDVLRLFDQNTHKIYTTATFDQGVEIDVNINEKDVIDAGLITKMISVNEDITSIPAVSHSEYKTLIDLAIAKQQKIEAEYRSHGLKIRPLILIQYPSEKADNDSVIRLVDEVDDYLEDKYGMSYKTDEVAKWFDGDKRNIGLDNQPKPYVTVLHIKQAISTGWDCPRAKILVKLRLHMNHTFEIQTLGRIRRMPEQKHYGIPLMDNCYLYTYDTDYKAEALKIPTSSQTIEIKLKQEFADKSFKLGLTKEEKSRVPSKSAKRDIGNAVRQYIIKKYSLETLQKNPDAAGAEVRNKQKLQDAGFLFLDHTEQKFVVGLYQEMRELQKVKEGNVVIAETATRQEERDNFRNCLRSISGHLNSENLQISVVEPIVERLFRSSTRFHKKNGIVLRLSEMDYWHFFINNHLTIEHDIKEASLKGATAHHNYKVVADNSEYYFPKTDVVAVPASGGKMFYKKNVYENYPVDVIPGNGKKSNVEIKFEEYLESNPDVVWWFKNGDKGPRYLSIVYANNIDEEYLFYPDYIIGMKDDTIGISETKGGWSQEEIQKNIDEKAELKFNALKRYVKEHNDSAGDDDVKISGFFVRDNVSPIGTELYESDNEWSDEMSDAWKLFYKKHGN